MHLAAYLQHMSFSAHMLYFNKNILNELFNELKWGKSFLKYYIINAQSGFKSDL